MLEEAAGEEETTDSVAMSAPMQPTKQMIEDHEVSHLPFRSWCTACVCGGAKSCAHYEQDKSQVVYNTYSVDYGFFGVPGQVPFEAVAGKDLSVLVGYDRKTKCPFAHPVPHKGLEKNSVESLYPVKVMAAESTWI